MARRRRVLRRALNRDRMSISRRAPSGVWDADQSVGHRGMKAPSHYHALLDKPRVSSVVVIRTEVSRE